MSKQVWQDLGELSARQQPIAGSAKRADEFGPEVALALAQLRSQHGLSNASCQSEGNKAENIPVVGELHDPGLDELRDELQTALPGVNRRGFLQLTGAAAVFALTGCWHKDPDTLVPYFQQPEGTTLGKAVWYSSIVRDSGRATPVMVKTYDGRPIKLEGNPDYAPLRGKLDTQSQAALLNLYDPDRRQTGPRGKSGDLTWEQLDAQIGAALSSGGVGLITGPIDGASTRALIDEFAQAFKGRFVHAAYHAYSPDAAVAARSASFGSAKPPVYHVDRAKILVTLGSDFLGGGETGLAEQVAFGDFRRVKSAGSKSADMGQVICFEPTMSQTGTVSDLRIRVSMDQMIGVAWALARNIAGKIGRSVPSSAPNIDAAALKLKPVADGERSLPAIDYVADRLIAVRKEGGASLIYVGGATHCGANSIPLHVAANFINEMLGNQGVTVESSSHAASGMHGSVAATRALLANNDARLKVDTLIVSGADPLFALAGAADALKNFKTVVVLADRENETFLAAAKVTEAYFAPTLHCLESWGDAEFSAGAFGIQQPCIHPLWDCRAAEESLMAFAVSAKTAPASFTQNTVEADPKQISVCSRKPLWQAAAHGVQSWRNYVQRTWLTALKPKAKVLSDDRTFWNAALARGVLAIDQAIPEGKAAFKDSAVQAVSSAPIAGKQLVLSASRVMRDGANLNNAWLQETPDPVSRITWDNYLAISVTDAKEFDLVMPRYDTNYENPVAKLTVGKTTVLVPVHIQEGQHPGTFELFLGWGNSAAGMVAKQAGVGGTGLNAFALQGPSGECWGIPAQIEFTGDTYRLACTQGHNRMEGRDIARDDVLDLHREDPDFKRRSHHHELWNKGKDGKEGGRLSMWHTTHTYPGRRWGMVIDMSTCIGCQACVVACTAENNVPVVGRDEVRKGREMHWIRIDRYYSGSGDDDLLDVEVFQQPMLCQHCAHAPCEEVCPPMATMHNDEGVNVQIYNRCIGTRYCSNNCPYKVRRFNYYEYSKYRMGPVNAGAPFERVVKNLVSEGATSSSNELSKAPLQMLLNPVVTVRSKGVMEKCNFCVQRTRDIREGEKATNKKYQDGSIKTACAQTCPTDAITFGDINDLESEVSKISAESHAYQVLDEELNTRPSVAYLRRMRNRPATADEAKKLAHEGAKHEEAPHNEEAH
jgi:Fe-S-cluster-containing dehydrogenase component